MASSETRRTPAEIEGSSLPVEGFPPRRLASRAACLLLLSVFCLPGMASAQNVMGVIEPGQRRCTGQVPMLSPERSIGVEFGVLTLAGAAVDAASQPLILTIGVPVRTGAGANQIQESRLLIEAPVAPRVLPSSQRIVLTHRQFGSTVRGPVSSCIENPEGNPAFRLFLSQSVIDEGPRIPVRGPVFEGGRVTVTCCRPDGDASSCRMVTTQKDDPLLPWICPAGTSPVL